MVRAGPATKLAPRRHRGIMEAQAGCVGHELPNLWARGRSVGVPAPAGVTGVRDCGRGAC